EQKITRQFQEAVTKKQYSCTDAELRGRQSDFLVHLERRKTDVVPVQVIQQKTQRQDRNESPRDLCERALFGFGRGSDFFVRVRYGTSLHWFLAGLRAEHHTRR